MMDSAPVIKTLEKTPEQAFNDVKDLADLEKALKVLAASNPVLFGLSSEEINSVLEDIIVANRTSNLSILVDLLFKVGESYPKVFGIQEKSSFLIGEKIAVMRPRVVRA